MTSKILTKKIDTYLTDMKELPPEAVSEVTSVKKEKPMSNSQLFSKQREEEIKKPATEAVSNQKGIFEDEFAESEEENEKPPFCSKDVILGIANLISIALLLIILARLPSKADELKSLRKEEFQSNDVTLESPGFIDAKKKADDLGKLFLDDSGIIDFVSDLEKIKNEAGIVTKLSFVSPKAVKDKSGNYGLAVLIEMSGSWEDIATNLQKIDSLPYIIRPITVDIQKSKDDPRMISYRYGLFLYTSPDLSGNK
jgi:hypothetical protein